MRFPIYVCFVSRLGGPAFHHWYQIFSIGGLDTDALLWVEDPLIHSPEAGGLLTLGSWSIECDLLCWNSARAIAHRKKKVNICMFIYTVCVAIISVIRSWRLS